MTQYNDQKIYGVVEKFEMHGITAVEDDILEIPIDFIESLIASGKVDIIMVALDKFTKTITFVHTREEAEKMRNFRLKNLIKSKLEN